MRASPRVVARARVDGSRHARLEPLFEDRRAQPAVQLAMQRLWQGRSPACRRSLRGSGSRCPYRPTSLRTRPQPVTWGQAPHDRLAPRRGVTTLSGRSVRCGHAARHYRRRDDADQRHGAGRLREGGRCVRRQLRRPRGARRGVRAVRRRRLQGRHLGRRSRRDDRPDVGRGHAAARVLDDEGCCRDLCGPARRGGQDRLRRPRRLVLAGVRGGGQGGDHGRAVAEPPGRAAVRRHAADVRRRHRRGPRRRRARRAEAGVGAGQRPRLSRPHLRLARRRTGPPGRWSSDRAVLRRRGGRPARPRLLDRPARVRGASCVAARAVPATVRSRRCSS